MIKTRLFCSAAACISVLGLISCSPEKKSKVDDFQVTAPEIQMADARGSMVAFNQTLDEILPPEAELVFPSLENSDLTNNPVDIATSSSCKVVKGTENKTNLEPKRFQQIRTFKNAARVPLLSFLPNELLLSPVDSICTLTFSASNKNSSTHDFVLSNVHIGSLNKTATLKLKGPNANAAETDRLVIAQNFLYQTSFAQENLIINASVNVTLRCDQFSSDRDYSDVKIFNLADLALAYKEQTGADVRTMQWEQHCRLITVPQGHPEKMEISRIFEIQFALPPLRYEMVDSDHSVDLEATATLRIHNDSSFNQLISFVSPSVSIHWSGLSDPEDPGSQKQHFDTTASQNLFTTLQSRPINGVVWYEVPASSETDIKFRSTKSLISSIGGQFTYTTSSFTINRNGTFASFGDLDEKSVITTDVSFAVNAYSATVHN